MFSGTSLPLCLGVLVHHHLKAVLAATVARWRCWQGWSRYGRRCCSRARGQQALQPAMRSHLSVRVARVAAVARGAIAGASALLSSFEASSAVTARPVAAAMLPGCRLRQVCYRGPFYNFGFCYRLFRARAPQVGRTGWLVGWLVGWQVLLLCPCSGVFHKVRRLCS